MLLKNADLGKKLKIIKLNDYKLKHLALQGAICFVLMRKKRYFVLQVLGRGRLALDINLENLIEVDYYG